MSKDKPTDFSFLKPVEGCDDIHIVLNDSIKQMLKNRIAELEEKQRYYDKAVEDNKTTYYTASNLKEHLRYKIEENFRYLESLE